MTPRTFAAFFLAASLLAPTARAEEAWKSYTNARFGFLLKHPPGLIASRAPDNGGGQEFHTRNKEFSVAAFAHFLLAENGDSLDKEWADELKELGDTVTYKKKTKDWCVISGVTKDGTEYYHKFFASGSNYAGFQITYPHAKNKQYDPWVERIAKDFVPFLKGDYDRIK
jgi:hypothetical protein